MKREKIIFLFAASSPAKIHTHSCTHPAFLLEKRLCLTGTRSHSLFPNEKVVKLPKNTPKKARKKPKHSSILSIST